jgi:hypothetical protein
MASIEHGIQQRILLSCGSGDSRLWRNNVGSGWTGQATRVNDQNRRSVAAALRPGDVVIRAGRILHAGLCVGSADAVGLVSVLVTPEHVGQRLGVFCGVEVKRPGGPATAGQRDWVSLIRRMGGRAGFAESVEQAQEILSGGPGRV